MRFTISALSLLFSVLILFLSVGLLNAKVLYIAQSDAGTADGSSCANAHAYTWFNTVGNWGVGATQIGVGDTVRICGTITNTVSFKGDGVTLAFEPGAKISTAAAVQIGMNSAKNATIDGEGVGIIECFDNGSELSNQLAVNSITASSCSNLVVKNLTIQNNYIHTLNSDHGIDPSSAGGIYANPIAGTNIFYGCTFSNVGWCINIQGGWTAAITEINVISNSFVNYDHGLGMASGTAGQYNPAVVNITANTFGGTENWDTAANTYHHDGIHYFGAGTNLLSMVGSRNLFTGEWGTNNTAHVYMEGIAGSKPENCLWYNNVFIQGTTTMNNGFFAGRGQFYNNTLIGSGLAGSLACGFNGSLSVVTNNIISGVNTFIRLSDAGASLAAANHNIYAAHVAEGGNDPWEMNTTNYASLAAWQAIAGESESTAPASVAVNADGSLQAGSSAIGAAAVITSIFTTDILGVARGTTWDIGAYEFVSTDVPPAGTAQISGNVQITGNIVLTVSLGTAVTNPPPNTNVWAQRFGGTSTDICRAIVSDASSGNIIMGGGFNGTVNFGLGALTSAGGTDMYLAGYNSSGTALWTKRFGGTGTEVVRGIALDGSGNVYVCGHFTGASDFGGGAVSSAGQGDIFIAKYSSVGVYQWQRIIGGTADDVAAAIAVDSVGNAIITGSFRGAVDFGGGTLFSQFSGMDSYLAKYSTAGAYVFANKYTNNADDDGIGVAVDASDNIILTGKFQGSIDMGGGSVASAGATDMYLAKFNSSGVHTWSDTFGGAFPDLPSGVTTDNSGNVYLLGSFNQIINMGGGNLTTASSDSDVVLAKYNSGGTYQWANAYAGPGNESPRGIATDDSGNTAIIGAFQYTINLGGGVLTSASTGITDAFVAKYNTSGTCLWSYRGGGVGADDGLAVGIDGSGYVAAGGSFSGNAGFGSTIFGSAGGTDIFLWRIAP